MPCPGVGRPAPPVRPSYPRVTRPYPPPPMRTRTGPIPPHLLLPSFRHPVLSVFHDPQPLGRFEKRGNCQLAVSVARANRNKERDMENPKEHLAMKTPPIVSPQEWEAARQQLLVKEKALTRARDALAAERRRMPWMAVEKKYELDGPKGKASLLELFDGRRQLIVYRAFFEPGVYGWPEHACRGCSFV